MNGCVWKWGYPKIQVQRAISAFLQIATCILGYTSIQYSPFLDTCSFTAWWLYRHHIPWESRLYSLKLLYMYINIYKCTMTYATTIIISLFWFALFPIIKSLLVSKFVSPSFFASYFWSINDIQVVHGKLHHMNHVSIFLQCEAPKIAKLASCFITPITMVYGGYIYPLVN